MLFMRSSKESEYLSPELSVLWHDITGKELRIREQKTDTGADIVLEVKTEGRKTSDTLLMIASIHVPDEVKAKYEEDPVLKPTITEFVNAAYAEKIEMLRNLIAVAMEGNRVVDMTGVTSTQIRFAVRIDRDEEDNEIGQTVTAQIEDAEPLNYSPAGLFE